jgi:hypothetical protein
MARRLSDECFDGDDQARLQNIMRRFAPEQPLWIPAYQGNDGTEALRGSLLASFHF